MAVEVVVVGHAFVEAVEASARTEALGWLIVTVGRSAVVASVVAAEVPVPSVVGHEQLSEKAHAVALASSRELALGYVVEGGQLC